MNAFQTRLVTTAGALATVALVLKTAQEQGGY